MTSSREEPEDRLATFAPPARAWRRMRRTQDASARCSPRRTSRSRRPVFEQYDCLVGSRTVRRPGAGGCGGAAAGARRWQETDRAIAVSIDGNGRRVACDPYIGAAEAVCECAANLACVGAEPLGLTNCLNFGNPEKPHVAWQLTRAVEGMAAACRALDVPVVGGNVSLYNEGPEGPIYPTPVVGMVGELPDVRAPAASAFAAGEDRDGRADRPVHALAAGLGAGAPGGAGWRAGSSPSTCARCARRSRSCATRSARAP